MSKPTAIMKRKRILPLALVFCTLVAGILIGTVVSDRVDAARGSDDPVTDAAPLSVPAAVPVDNQFSELARKLRPSVVSIEIPAVEPDEEDERGFFNDQEDMFRRFFGLPNSPAPPPQRRGPGQGSGVIVDPKGYIITNNHVVEGAERIRVQFAEDDQRYDAKLIGVDPETDLAVIYVKGKEGLQAAKIGNSDAANVGDWAVAIGSPFGYRETVTVGIISATAREMRSGGPGRRGRPFQKFLQTDAAINPGNSGGPLLNIRGEVIGINTAIISRTGGYDGIGFALASNIAVETYNQITRYGRVSRGSIGVEFQSDVSQSLIRSYGAEWGVFVRRTVDDGPAADAGMKNEDIILSVDNVKINDGEKLIEVVSEIPIGKTVPIEVMRDGKTLTLDVEIADRQKLYPEQAAAPFDVPEEGEESVSFGITVQELSREIRSELPDDLTGGVWVTRVEANSFADDIGLSRGDIIVALNREPISAIKDLRDIQQELEPGQDISFKLRRNDGREWATLYLAGVVPE